MGHLGGSVSKCLTSAQVIVSWSVGLSPVSGSVLTSQSLGPASDSASPSLSAPSHLPLYSSLSEINENILEKYRKQIKDTHY